MGRLPALIFGLLVALLWLSPAAGAETRVAHFDSAEREFDPSFDLDGLVVSFRVDEGVNPAGRVQFMGLPGRPPPDPFAGAGHLRLSQSDGGGLPVAMWLDFSEPVSAFTVYAYQIACYAEGVFPVPSRCQNPLVIEVWSTANELLGTLETPRLVEPGPVGRRPGPLAYDPLHFESTLQIGSLRILGDTNRSALDELSVTLWSPAPSTSTAPSCGLGAEVVLLLLPLWTLRGRRGLRSSARSQDRT